MKVPNEGIPSDDEGDTQWKQGRMKVPNEGIEGEDGGGIGGKDEGILKLEMACLRLQGFLNIYVLEASKSDLQYHLSSGFLHLNAFIWTKNDLQKVVHFALKMAVFGPKVSHFLKVKSRHFSGLLYGKWCSGWLENEASKT